MTFDDCKLKLHELKFNAGFNARYHQILESRYGRWDKGIRIAVGVLAVIGLFFAIKDEPPFGVIVALVSLVAAIILNIVPVGDLEKKHGELFRLWNDLLKDADIASLAVCGHKDLDSVSEENEERILDLVKKFHALNSSERAPKDKLLEQCQDAETKALSANQVTA